MFKIKVADKILDANKGDNLYQVLTFNNISVRSSCGGIGACGDCMVKIINGDNLNSFTATESHYLGNVYHMTKERLSCQCIIDGDVEIELIKR